MDFHQRIRDAYLSLYRNNPDRFRMIDSSEDFIDVKQQVEKAVLDFIE
jgi:thymidylate kinase